jgi:cell wall-associated NlpC family hydrolase
MPVEEYGYGDERLHEWAHEPRMWTADATERWIVDRHQNLKAAGRDFIHHGKRYNGVSNPYGLGVSAFEPNTEVLPPVEQPEVYEPAYDTNQSDNPLLKGYADAYNAVEDSKVTDSVASATLSVNGPSFTGGSGTVNNIINAARTLLGKPYVWGGTTNRGVDCSGLIYYAFNAAGINMPRYRAIDYGTRVGTSVSASQARAGDLVYFDNPNSSTDHVGLYLGNGTFIEAPQSGDVVKISQIRAGAMFRRVLDDKAFGQMATPSGGTTTSYAGMPASNVFTNPRPVSVSSPVNIKSYRGQYASGL